MKKATVLFAMFTLLFSAPMMAQMHEHGSKKEKMSESERMEKMEQELDLTEEQKIRVREINEAYKEREMAQREKMKALRGEMKQLREQKRKEVFSILTPEQQKKAMANRKKNVKKKQANDAMHKERKSKK
jgi:Spy/CpxP family protein refolding chaperone